MSTHALRCLLATASLSALLATGCGGDGPEVVPVSGNVTWNGDPMPSGTIVFRPADGVARSEAGQIEEGYYSLDVPPGAKTVEITARRVVEGKFDTSNPGEKVPLTEQYVPKEYNAETTLEADVGDTTSFDFSLEGS